MIIDFQKIINNNTLVDVLYQLGYKKQKDKSTKSVHSYKNAQTGDVVLYKIKQNQEYYSNVLVEKDFGSVINFVANRQTGIVSQAKWDKATLTYIKNYFNILNIGNSSKIKNEKPISTKKEKFDLSKYSLKYDLSYNVKKFLRERNIDENIINNKEFKEKITSFGKNIISKDGKKLIIYNIGFPLTSIKNDIIGYAYKFINKNNKTIKQLAKNSNKEDSIWKSNFNKNTNSIMITEDPLDCLSHYLLNKQPNIGYIATLGRITNNQLKIIDYLRLKIIKNNKSCNIILGNDNDKAGLIANINLLEFLKGNKFTYSSFKEKEKKELIDYLKSNLDKNIYLDIPTLKDWNEDLKQKQLNQPNKKKIIKSL